MISRIIGILVEKTPPTLVVEVGGLAYEIEAPMSTIYDLPEVGEQVTLHTHLLVREDTYCMALGNQEKKLLLGNCLRLMVLAQKSH